VMPLNVAVPLQPVVVLVAVTVTDPVPAAPHSTAMLVRPVPEDEPEMVPPTTVQL
jgi:hypothetical protein